MLRVWRWLAAAAALGIAPAAAWAQGGGGAPDAFENCATRELLTIGLAPDPVVTVAFFSRTVSGYRLTGSPVAIVCDDTRVTADDVVVAGALFVATGNVVLEQKGLRVWAERVVLDRRTRLGTFYNAFGSAQLTERPVDKTIFGAMTPDVYFSGERIERVSARRYRLTRAEFSTCVQPTPRWVLQGSDGTFTIDERVVLKNAVLKVKNVPLFYLPVLYYPINDEDRSTGFLMPSYASSALQGAGISNAFFWAIGRSHDATFYHTYFSKSGQSVAGEYRYITAPGSDGSARFTMLSERAERAADGTTVVRPAHQAYTLDGRFNQALPGGFRLFGSANYFTDLATEQRYQQNLFDLSQRQRYIGGTIDGTYRRVRVATTFEQRDAYYSTGTSATAQRTGRGPQITVSLPDRPIGRSQVYFGARGEVGYFIRRDDVSDPLRNQSLWRFDAMPTVRAPLSRLPFLSATASAAWRVTHWLESRDPATGAIRPASITRQLLDVGVDVTGPTFSRIFTPANSAYAERFKHLIEPRLSLRWLSPFDRFNEVVQIDGTDTQVGGTTTLNYSVANRLLVRRKRAEGPGEVRTLLTVTASQSYYTNALAAQYDSQYQTATASSFGPLQLVAVAEPAENVRSDFRLYIDARHRVVQSLSSGVTVDRQGVQVRGQWSKRRFIAGVPGFNVPSSATHYLGATTSLKLADGRYGATYGFNFDALTGSFLEQRVLAYYTAQCCGISVDFQSLRGSPLFNIPPDRRFGISISLAGVGSFSNPFGSFGSGSGRR